MNLFIFVCMRNKTGNPIKGPIFEDIIIRKLGFLFVLVKINFESDNFIHFYVHTYDNNNNTDTYVE